MNRSASFALGESNIKRFREIATLNENISDRTGIMSVIYKLTHTCQSVHFLRSIIGWDLNCLFSEPQQTHPACVTNEGRRTSRILSLKASHMS